MFQLDKIGKKPISQQTEQEQQLKDFLGSDPEEVIQYIIHSQLCTLIRIILNV